MRKNLRKNETAISIIKTMAHRQKSDTAIKKELYNVCGIRWTVDAIAKNRCLLGFKKVSPIPSSTKTQEPPQVKSTKTPTAPPLFIKLLQELHPDCLPFGRLCEHTASFFEDLANYPRNQKAPQSMWDIARDKVMHWNSFMRRNPTLEIERLSPQELRAYDYCQAMYASSLGRNDKSRYREIYGLYREWRNFCVVSQQG